MKPTPSLKKIFIEIICLLYILLFVYAAISKLIDFENFQVQLGQSPLLSAFAGFVAPMVIVTELVIAVILAFPKCRIAGLYLAVSLMAMFTAYIVIILNFSSFIPCSCGGILEHLGWTEHLFFNGTFIVIGIIAVLANGVTKSTLYVLPAVLLLSPMIVALLYVRSEAVMHTENPFIRRYEMFAVSKKAAAELENPSFYFAGYDKSTIYLGNHSAPLHIVAFDYRLNRKKYYVIRLDNDKHLFRSVEVRIAAPYFYLYDGSVPVIYRGKLSDWKAETVYSGTDYFTQALPMDSLQVGIRGQARKTGEHILGKINIGDTTKVAYAPALLEKQIDGVFDTDGTFQYSPLLKKFTYTYYYRNQYVIADTIFNLTGRGHTIDTITKAHLKVKTIRSSGDTKTASPPLMVNRNTTLYNNLLFVNSSLVGKYEDEEVWDQAAVIDVYDILKRTYKFSFYVYGDGKYKPKKFLATDKGFYTITQNRLEHYTYGKPVSKAKITADKLSADSRGNDRKPVKE